MTRLKRIFISIWTMIKAFFCPTSPEFKEMGVDTRSLIEKQTDECIPCKWHVCFWEHGHTFTFEAVWMSLMIQCRERMAIECNGDTICKPWHSGKCKNFKEMGVDTSYPFKE